MVPVELVEDHLEVAYADAAPHQQVLNSHLQHEQLPALPRVAKGLANDGDGHGGEDEPAQQSSRHDALPRRPARAERSVVAEGGDQPEDAPAREMEGDGRRWKETEGGGRKWKAVEGNGRKWKGDGMVTSQKTHHSDSKPEACASGEVWSASASQSAPARMRVVSAIAKAGTSRARHAEVSAIVSTRMST